MTAFIIAILLISLALLTLALQKAYFYLPYKELKRQAAARDPLARVLFRAAAYGAELKLSLWFVLSLSAAGGFVMFASVAPPVLGFVVVALTLWLGFAWIPRSRLSRFGVQLAVWCTPVVVRCLRLLHPPMEYIAMYLGRLPMGPHTGLYEREDLYDLLEQQKRQGDSRISQHELDLMRQVLGFGNRTVADILVPRRNVRALSASEHLGPVLLDELHKSGHSHFPVYEGKPGNIVSLLALDTVADTKEHGSVGDHANSHVAYAHEADSLAQAVRAFYDTAQPLLVVVNNRDEYVGIITLRDVIRCLMGDAQHEPLAHDDRQAVAARHIKQQSSQEGSHNSSDMVE